MKKINLPPIQIAAPAPTATTNTCITTMIAYKIQHYTHYIIDPDSYIIIYHTIQYTVRNKNMRTDSKSRYQWS